jgi:hypothetical protein
MVTRAELLRAHRFLRRRIVNAIESGDPETPPSRRNAAVVVGAVLSLLVAGAAVARHYTNRSPQWQRSDAVIIERETGAAYVYVHGVLHPTANYVSARLALGLSSARVITVAQADLQGAASGPAWGIAGAPNSAPSAADLVSSWAVCTDKAGVASLSLGVPVGGSPMVAVVVANQFNQTFMIVGDRQTQYSGDALPQATVPLAFLAAIPAVNKVDAVPSKTPPGTMCAINEGTALHVVTNAKAPATRVAIVAGRGALVRSDVGTDDVEVVIGGVAYPVMGEDALTSLGLAGVSPMALPQQALSLLPHGVPLSRAAAMAGQVG